MYRSNIEKYLPQIRRMRLLDDNFMRAVFDNNIEGAQDVLRIILDRKDLTVQSVVPQQEIKNTYGRSVRLDICATDSAGKIYDIEIQRADSGAGAKRARYNQSLVDANSLPAGREPELLPEIYVIFFTENDVLGAGLPIYHIERIVTETNGLFDDGEHIIYVNGSFRNDGSELGTLIADFRETDPKKVKIQSLADRIKHLKESEEGVKKMCRIVEDIVEKERQEAIKEGRLEGRREMFLENIKGMWENNISLNIMASIAKCTEDEIIEALNELGLPISQNA